MSNVPVKAFLSYAHEDESYKDELLKFLKPLTRNNVLSVWNDRAILVGDKWDDFSSTLINNNDSLKLSDFQGLPTNLKPIKSWEDSDEAWMNVVKGLENLIKFINSNR